MDIIDKHVIQGFLQESTPEAKKFLIQLSPDELEVFITQARNIAKKRFLVQLSPEKQKKVVERAKKIAKKKALRHKLQLS